MYLVMIENIDYKNNSIYYYYYYCTPQSTPTKNTAPIRHTLETSSNNRNRNIKRRGDT